MSIEDLSDAAPVYGGEDVFGVYGKFRWYVLVKQKVSVHKVSALGTNMISTTGDLALISGWALIWL
jgi:hypothetical protein